jgi:hypothetical protein
MVYAILRNDTCPDPLYRRPQRKFNLDLALQMRKNGCSINEIRRIEHSVSRRPGNPFSFEYIRQRLKKAEMAEAINE